MNTRFDLSPRLRPVAVPGRPAVYRERALIGYDQHGPCYAVAALDDTGREVRGYTTGEGRWTIEPPAICRACAVGRP